MKSTKKQESIKNQIIKLKKQAQIKEYTNNLMLREIERKNERKERILMTQEDKYMQK